MKPKKRNSFNLFVHFQIYAEKLTMLNTLAQAEDGAHDKPTQLTKLLSDSSPRKRCIDRVAHHLDEILEARRRRITWDVIAEAMTMNRGTLINAFKQLTSQENGRTKLVLPATSPKPVSSHLRVMPSSQSDSVITNATYPNAGMTTLGRTKIENFNL
jgi:hypothetical protein